MGVGQGKIAAAAKARWAKARVAAKKRWNLLGRENTGDGKQEMARRHRLLPFMLM